MNKRINPAFLRVGEIVEISKAFEMETGRQTGMDEIAHCEATVLEARGNEVCVWIDWVSGSRMRTRSAA